MPATSTVCDSHCRPEAGGSGRAALPSQKGSSSHLSPKPHVQVILDRCLLSHDPAVPSSSASCAPSSAIPVSFSSTLAGFTSPGVGIPPLWLTPLVTAPALSPSSSCASYSAQEMKSKHLPVASGSPGAGLSRSFPFPAPSLHPLGFLPSPSSISLVSPMTASTNGSSFRVVLGSLPLGTVCPKQAPPNHTLGPSAPFSPHK